MEDTDWMDWAARVWYTGTQEQRELLLRANGLDHLLPLAARRERLFDAEDDSGPRAS